MRIFGPDKGSPAKDLDASTGIVNVSYPIKGIGKLTGYGYFLDIEDAPGISSKTIGLSLTGKQAIGENNLLYRLEYADQDDHGDNPNSYSAGYYVVELGFATSSFTVKGGLETLEGDGKASGKAFTTPLATLHKFQGWADKFLNTPDAGIEDTYISVAASPFGTKIGVTYHIFDAESSSAEYGTELDFSIAKKINDNFGVLLKYAAYDADDFSVDTDKIWFMVTAKF
jgi:hypothetical protein